jgi:hypothetical protein
MYDDNIIIHTWVCSVDPQGDPGDVISTNRFGEKGTSGLPGIPGVPVSPPPPLGLNKVFEPVSYRQQ